MNIEETIRWVETQGESAGWNSDIAGPMLFEVRVTGVDQCEPVFPPELNLALIKLCGTMEPADALLQLADRAESVTKMLRKWGFPASIGQPDSLVGIGYRSEGYRLEVTPYEVPPVGKLQTDPRSVELRFVQFFGKDGCTATLMRVRGEVPEFTSDIPIAGAIPHAVTRILNAIVPEEVPIAPMDPDGLCG